MKNNILIRVNCVILMAGLIGSYTAMAVETENLTEVVDRKPAIVEARKKEILIDIQGLTDYGQYARIRNKIEDHLPEGSFIRVKQLARGKALLSLETVVATNELSQVLVNLSLEPGYFLLKGIEENRIRVEVQ